MRAHLVTAMMSMTVAIAGCGAAAPADEPLAIDTTDPVPAPGG